MSSGTARARPHTTTPLRSRAIRRTASKSSGEAMGKPASMMSTPSHTSCRAISSFSSEVSEAPGDCSPSRRVVSKMYTRSAIVSLLQRVDCALTGQDSGAGSNPATADLDP